MAGASNIAPAMSSLDSFHPDKFPRKVSPMKISTLATFVTLLFVLVVAAACGNQAPAQSQPAQEPAQAEAPAAGLPDWSPNPDGYTDITVEQLAAALQTKDFTLVNVHIPYQGELPDTDTFVPFDQILANLDKLPGKDEPVVLYCRSGSMSTVAAKALAEAGYTNVYELDGGFNAWKAAGYDLLMKQ